MNPVVSWREKADSPPRRRSDDDWKKVAPRWFLLLVIAAGLVVVGGLVTRERYLDGALADAPTKYQARLSERVAANEAEIAAQKIADREYASEMKELRQAMSKLTVQVELLTVAVNTNSRRR